MKATRRALTATVRKAGGRHFRRRPLAFALAVAMVVSLFHDLPALAGQGGSDPMPVAVASTSALVEAPDTQAPGHGCHCLCHIAAQTTVSQIVTRFVFDHSIQRPGNGVPSRALAGLPPFRPPR